MVEQVRQAAPSKATLARLIGVGVLVALGAGACSSADSRTEVRGEVVTRDDQYLGGPNPAIAEFRAGERSVYGNTPTIP